MPEYSDIRFDVEGDVAQLTLNRPAKKNAMSPAMIDEMTDVFERVEDGDASLLVIDGAGDSFCAGMDLEKRFKEPRETGPAAYREVSKRTGKMWTMFRHMEVPTITKVHGNAFGGGFMLAGLSDFAIAAEETTFGLSEINFGIFAGGGTMWTVVNIMGRRDAMYYTSTGEQFDGSEAADLGVVTKAVPESKLDGKVEDLVETLDSKNDLALQYNKAVLERVRFMQFDEAREYERAKSEEMKYFQDDEWADSGLTKFAEGEYRPGESSYTDGESD